MPMRNRNFFVLSLCALGVFLGFLFCSPQAVAANFVVQRIQIVGLQNIQSNTVRNYVPFHEGQLFTDAKGDQILVALYKTGFFDDVRLAQSGGALLIYVKERPAISLLEVTGNKEISDKDMKPVLKKAGLEAGTIYDPLKLSQFKQSLEHQYGVLGYRATVVTTTVQPLSGNRVAVYIHVDEGPITKVESIEFVGNHAFTARQLRHQMALATPGITTWVSSWITHDDRFSKEKLEEDSRAVTDFYLNHGYLQFRIVSTETTLTADHKKVRIVLTVSEGPQFHVGGFDVSGDTLGYHDELSQQVLFKQGDVFSRQKAIDSNLAIGHYLANKGYAFAVAEVLPRLDAEKHLVFLTFQVKSGRRVYVHRIQFFGNDRTQESVMRREARQMEGGLYSLKNVDETKRRIGLLPYFKDVTVDTKPVEGSPDEVDLDYTAKEVSAGKASAQVGYSDSYGFLYGAGISEPDFLGSGRSVSIGFTNSQVQQYYNIAYENPYFTTNGVSQAFTLYYSRATYNPNFNYQSYTTDGYGLDMVYGFPLSERNTVSAGLGFGGLSVDNVQSTVAPSVLNFLSEHPSPYYILKGLTGWSYNGLDQYIFPNKGLYHSLSGEIGAPGWDASVPYFKVTENVKWFYPLGYGFVVNAVSRIGYGSGYSDMSTLPFFLNYYAGGIDGGVPAYAPNSLGPKNTADSNAALGGNLITTAGVHLIVPNFLTEKLRTAILFDVGNVYQTQRFQGDLSSPSIIQDDTFSLNNLRTSLGLGVTWYSPIGPVNVTMAFPLNKRAGDQLEFFQFSFGTSV